MAALAPVPPAHSPISANEEAALHFLRERSAPRAMFSDVLLDSAPGFKQSRRGATLLSFITEAVLIGVLITLPLFFTDTLPTYELITYLTAPLPPPPPPPPAASAPQQAAAKVVKNASDLTDTGKLRAPAAIPNKIAMIKEDEVPPPASGVGVVGGVPGGIPGGTVGGVIGGVLGGILKADASAASVPKLAAPVKTTPKVIRVSQGVSAGMLIYDVKPVYPPLAKTARIQGDVVLHAYIATDGSIKNLTAVSGHPMLIPAAIDAMRQRRYRPYLLNGVPVEVETSITVTFVLAQ